MLMILIFDRKLELPGSRSQAGAWVQAKIRSRFPQNTVQRLGGFQLNPHELGKSHRDYRNGGGKVLHTLKTIDFIGRLIRHIPPHYFNVIRHFGILASRVKKKYKGIADCLLEPPPEVDEAPTWRERQTAFRGSDPLLCGICGRVMRFVSSRIPIPLWRVKERLQAAFS